MKSFIIKFSLYSVIIFAVFVFVDLLLSVGLKKSKTMVDGEFIVWNEIFSEAFDMDLVVYGGSRAMVHFNTEMIEQGLNRQSYNLGMNGLEFLHQYVRHREYMNHNDPPKYILMSIDGYTFQKDRNLFNEDQFLPYLLHNMTFKKYLLDINSFSFIDYYLPLVRYYGRRGAIKRGIKGLILGEEKTSNRHKGYTARDLEWNDDFGNAMASLGHYEIKIDSMVYDLFDGFLKECREKNIKVIMVYTPEYIGVDDFVINRNEGIKIIEDFSTKYNIPFFNYTKDELCFSKEYFYNALHLNKTGSTLFTQKLIDDLKKTNELHGIWHNKE